MKLLALAVLAAGTIVAPVSATTTSTYNLVFDNGNANVFPSPARTVVGDYEDIFNFTVPTNGNFSGSLTTEPIYDQNGTLVSALTFSSVDLDGSMPFTPNAAKTGVRLTSTPLTPGVHSLVVDYTVNVASAGNAASYGGPANFAPAAAVPEPATWAMFVGAFGIVGAGLRQRKAAAARLA